jgi:hypothetical protein
MYETLVGQIGNLIGNLGRIANPPARCGSEPSPLAVLPASCGRRIANPPQVHNLPHKHGSMEGAWIADRFLDWGDSPL